jgi:hypothetical protein
MPAMVRMVDELRDFDVDLPASTLSVDFPAADSPDFARWDRHDVFVDLDKTWEDAAGDRWTHLLCARRSGELFVSSGRVRPLSERRPGERCLAPVRLAAEARGRVQRFWPCFVELDLPRPGG